MGALARCRVEAVLRALRHEVPGTPSGAARMLVDVGQLTEGCDAWHALWGCMLHAGGYRCCAHAGGRSSGN